ncbi:MAG: hypothetical protein WKF42_04485 [Solirubrobacteraceae bacterium]
MRRLLPLTIALLLGVGSALLVACGASTQGGIPAASAGELKSQISDVREAVDGGRCDDVDGQLRQVDNAIEELPSTVDERLRQSLSDAGDTLRRAARDECDEATETTETETLPTETQPEPPQTATEPETQPEPPQTEPPPPPPPPAETTPLPPPPPITPPVPPAEPSNPPPAPPSGGARPELEP